MKHNEILNPLIRNKKHSEILDPLIWNNTMFNGTVSIPLTVKNLRRDHIYQPLVRVYFTISKSILGYSENISLHSVECVGRGIKFDLWQCLNNNKYIPWNAGMFRFFD